MFRDKWFKLTDAERFRFIERSVLIHDSKGNTFPLVLAEFQREWLSRGPLFTDFRKLTDFRNRIVLKCRNVGASYIMIALEAVFTAWLYPNITVPFVAPSEDQTKNLIGSCMSLISDVRFDLGLKGGFKNQTKGEIVFLNGSKIKAFSSNPKSLRGTRALCVYLDEFAHVEHDQDIYDAVNYFIQEGGQLNVLSTPWGKQNLYWRIWSDIDSYPDWDRIDIKPFYGNVDLSRPLPEQLESGDITLAIPWLNITKVENDRRADSHNGYRNFMQEMLGIPLEEVSSVVSSELLDTVTRDNFSLGSRTKGSQVFAVGVDYGASNNMTAAVSSAFVDGRLVVCDTSQFSGNVDIQIADLVEYVNRYSHDYYFGDYTGLGGHAQPLDSMVLTPSGFVTMGSIKVGDTICDIDGGVQRVNHIYPQGVQKVYKIGFSDGTFVKATGDHLWEVNDRKLFTTLEIKYIINSTEYKIEIPSCVVDGKKKTIGNRIISVEEFGEDVCQCINVDKGLYITDNYKVTHNSFQDVLGARDVNVGMIVGIDYSKKDISARFGSPMNNKEYMINRALELFARGLIIVPKNFRELRLQILGVKKYVYDNHVKYSGKDSLTKNDDLAMAFFQMVLAYDYHFGLGDVESVSSSNVDWANRDSKPKAKKALYFEGGSVSPVKVTRSGGGFGRYG